MKADEARRISGQATHGPVVEKILAPIWAAVRSAAEMGVHSVNADVPRGTPDATVKAVSDRLAEDGYAVKLEPAYGDQREW